MIAGVSLVVAAVLGRWWQGRMRAARRLEACRHAVPELVELLVILVRSGSTPALSFASLGSGLAPEPLAAAVADVADRVRRGERFADALDALREHHGELLDPLAAMLAHTDRYGEPVGPVLERLGADARHERRRQSEAEARRLPIRLCAPLVCCVLPAFVVLTIVPMLAGTFSSLRGLSATTPDPTSLPQGALP